MAIWDDVRPLILMLGGEHDGEVVAAARAIERKLKSAQLTLHDLAARVVELPSEQPRQWKPQDDSMWTQQRDEDFVRRTDPYRGRERHGPAEIRRRILFLYAKKSRLGESVEWRHRSETFITDLKKRLDAGAFVLTPRQLKWLDDLWTRYGP